jgi:hypothetical protein
MSNNSDANILRQQVEVIKTIIELADKTIRLNTSEEAKTGGWAFAPVPTIALEATGKLLRSALDLYDDSYGFGNEDSIAMTRFFIAADIIEKTIQGIVISAQTSDDVHLEFFCKSYNEMFDKVMLDYRRM